MKLTGIAYRNIKRNKRRSILSGVAIAIAVMTIVFLFAFLGGMMGDMRGNVQNYITGDIRLRTKSYQAEEELNPLHLGIENSAEIAEIVRGVENVQAVTRRILFGTAIYGSPRLCLHDIKDYGAFLSFLSQPGDPVRDYLMQRVSVSLSQQMESHRDSAEVPHELKVQLLDYLNKVLISFSIIESVEIPVDSLPAEAALLLEGGPLVDKLYFNRLVLQDVLGEHILPSFRMNNTYTSAGFGIDFETEQDFLNLESMVHDGRIPAPGKSVKEMVLTSGLARHMDLTVGDKLTIYTQTSTGMMNSYTFRVVGIMTSSVLSYNAHNFFLPLDTTQSLLRMGDKSIDILVDVKNENKLDDTAAQLATVLSGYSKDELEIEPWTEIGLFSFLINYSFIMYSMIAAIFFIIGSTVIINTTMMVIYERMREIGTLAAMGMKGKEIVKLFFLEAFFIAAISAFIGAIVGLAVVIPTSIVGFDLSSMLGDGDFDFPISSLVYPTFNPGVVLFVYIYAVLVASVASMIPSRKAARIEPVEALRTV